MGRKTRKIYCDKAFFKHCLPVLEILEKQINYFFRIHKTIRADMGLKGFCLCWVFYIFLLHLHSFTFIYIYIYFLSGKVFKQQKTSIMQFYFCIALKGNA